MELQKFIDNDCNDCAEQPVQQIDQPSPAADDKNSLANEREAEVNIHLSDEDKNENPATESTVQQQHQQDGALPTHEGHQSTTFPAQNPTHPDITLPTFPPHIADQSTENVLESPDDICPDGGSPQLPAPLSDLNTNMTSRAPDSVGLGIALPTLPQQIGHQDGSSATQLVDGDLEVSLDDSIFQELYEDSNVQTHFDTLAETQRIEDNVHPSGSVNFCLESPSLYAELVNTQQELFVPKSRKPHTVRLDADVSAPQSRLTGSVSAPLLLSGMDAPIPIVPPCPKVSLSQLQA